MPEVSTVVHASGYAPRLLYILPYGLDQTPASHAALQALAPSSRSQCHTQMTSAGTE